VISDDRGVPVSGVSMTAGGITTVTDAAGRYEIRSQSMALVVTSMMPPAGYEGGFSGYGTLTPGRRDYALRRITGITISSRSPIPVTDGTLWFGVVPTVTYATGEVARLAGASEENVQLTSSDSAVLRTRRDSGRPVIEGVAPGTATVTATYWSVASPPVTVQVIPR
jgi:hypothetical protein